MFLHLRLKRSIHLAQVMIHIFLTRLRTSGNPMVVFVYGILTKWYIIVAIPSIIVVYWVLTGLKNAGVLDTMENTVVNALNETKIVARYCVPKILDFKDFYSCLNNIDAYQNQEATQAELDLEKSLNEKSFEQVRPRAKSNFNINPYEVHDE